jgi:Uma2 family endonuclease
MARSLRSYLRNGLKAQAEFAILPKQREMTATFLPNERTQTLRLTLPGLSRGRFFHFCVKNRDLRIERSAEGELIIMPPTDHESGRRNSELNYQLVAWAKRDGTGVVYDSSTGFELPNAATRSPDASWIRRDRLETVLKPRKGFLKICPDFVIELRSPSDRLPTLKAKMEEYIANGARLGFLIDPIKKTAWIYSADAEPGERTRPKTLDGGDVLPGFKLDLEPIWAEKL